MREPWTLRRFRPSLRQRPYGSHPYAREPPARSAGRVLGGDPSRNRRGTCFRVCVLLRAVRHKERRLSSSAAQGACAPVFPGVM
jgi:hypothetical protein